MPGPYDNLPIDYRKEGIGIGDVGVLLRFGTFSYFFNIFLPADHPVNAGNVPDNFEPLDLSILQRQIKKEACFAKMDYIKSSSVRTQVNVESSYVLVSRDINACSGPSCMQEHIVQD